MSGAVSIYYSRERSGAKAEKRIGTGRRGSGTIRPIMSAAEIFDGMTLTWGDLGLTKARPPAHLPDPSPLVTFDMAEEEGDLRGC